MKQTAVEWLADKMLTEHHSKIEWYKIVEQAKEMEKEDIIDAAMWMPKSFNLEFIRELAEQYYNETFLR